MLLLGVMVSLHAFGYYYANQLQVGPAMTPYIKIGSGRLEFPLGDLLKHFVWDRNDRSRQNSWNDRNGMNGRMMNGTGPASAPAAQPPRPVRPSTPR